MKGNVFAVAAGTGIVAALTTAYWVSTASAAQKEPSVQGGICYVSDFQANSTSACKPGQKIAFPPNSWGNDQLPLMFISANCDFRYPVVMNNGGAVCVHAKIDPNKVQFEFPHDKK